MEWESGRGSVMHADYAESVCLANTDNDVRMFVLLFIVHKKQKEKSLFSKSYVQMRTYPTYAVEE